MSVPSLKVTNGMNGFFMPERHRSLSLWVHCIAFHMLEASNGTGSAISHRLAIPAFWKPSHLSASIRRETPDAYAAYRTWVWSGSVDCTGVLRYDSNVSGTFRFISLEQAIVRQVRNGLKLAFGVCVASLFWSFYWQNAASSLTLQWHWDLYFSCPGKFILNL